MTDGGLGELFGRLEKGKIVSSNVTCLDICTWTETRSRQRYPLCSSV